VDYNGLSLKIIELYNKMSDESQAFSEKNGVSCVSGCGDCCSNPDVYCSPTEMIPMALDIIEKDDQNRVLLILKETKKENCILWSEKRCSKYGTRPTICRLFGWTKVNDKSGKKRLSICGKIKENLSPLRGPIPVEEAPSISYWSEKITELNPSFNLSGLYPINRSLLIAIETILFIRQLENKL
jgi:uncharacterized protein